MALTGEQQAVVAAGRDLGPGERMGVLAYAGTGKTTTLKSLAKARPDRGIYLAFNRAIAEEARLKLASTRCNAATMHGLAFGAIRDLIGQPATLNTRSLIASGLLSRFRLPRVAGWSEYTIASAAIRCMQEFANSADAKLGVEHGRAALISMVGDPELASATDRKDRLTAEISALSEIVSTIARTYWTECRRDRIYSHDMYLKELDINPTLLREAFRGYGYAMIDEAQDINPVQMSILAKAGLTLIAVGDPYQQIYSWRGAVNALAGLGGKTLHLTQSFRFGPAIAEIGMDILRARPEGAPSRPLIGAGGGQSLQRTTRAIICRTNFGMINEASRALSQGRSIHIDNVDALLSDVMSAKALRDRRMKEVTSPQVRCFESWAEFREEAQTGGPLGILYQIVEKQRTQEVIRLAEASLSTPDKADFVICTAHRSKGLEWSQVALGADWAPLAVLRQRYDKALTTSARDVTAALEEFNTLYVAATRAMHGLHRIAPLLMRRPEETLEPPGP